MLFDPTTDTRSGDQARKGRKQKGKAARMKRNTNHSPLAASLIGAGLILSGALFGAISVAHATGYSPSKIIGINPLVPVKVDGSNIPEALRPTLDAFGLVAVGNSGACSGTHIGNGYVLTAGHCFIDGDGPGVLSNEACATTKLYWGYRGSPATGTPKPLVTLVSKCVKIVHAELNDDRDYALLQVDQMPASSIPVAVEPARTTAGTPITIFGYPMGRPLEWSQFCSIQRSTVVGAPFDLPSRMAHQCDTQHGNSGSSMLAQGANGGLKVVGIHAASAPDPIRYNMGTYMLDIRKALQRAGINVERLSGAAQ